MSGLALVSILAIGILSIQPENPVVEPEKTSILDSILSPVVEPPTAVSKTTDNTIKPIDVPLQPNTEAPETSTQNSKAIQPVTLNAWDVGKGPLNDELYYRIAEKLKTDPQFLAALLSEFQGETDTKRLKKLAALLSESKDESVRSVAIEMLASGIQTSETAALSLLGKIQHRDPEAQQAILQVIRSRSDSPTLVSALNALGVANRALAPELKADIVNHISPLTQHHEPTVRRHSFNLLFRWAADTEHLLPQLRLGLRDPDPRVRRSTALGFAASPQNDEETKQELFRLLFDQNETARNRKAAASALKKWPLLSHELAQVKLILDELRGQR